MSFKEQLKQLSVKIKDYVDNHSGGGGGTDGNAIHAVDVLPEASEQTVGKYFLNNKKIFKGTSKVKPSEKVEPLKINLDLGIGLHLDDNLTSEDITNIFVKYKDFMPLNNLNDYAEYFAIWDEFVLSDTNDDGYTMMMGIDYYLCPLYDDLTDSEYNIYIIDQYDDYYGDSRLIYAYTDAPRDVWERFCNNIDAIIQDDGNAWPHSMIYEIPYDNLGIQNRNVMYGTSIKTYRYDGINAAFAFNEFLNMYYIIDEEDQTQTNMRPLFANQQMGDYITFDTTTMLPLLSENFSIYVDYVVSYDNRYREVDLVYNNFTTEDGYIIQWLGITDQAHSVYTALIYFNTNITDPELYESIKEEFDIFSNIPSMENQGWLYDKFIPMFNIRGANVTYSEIDNLDSVDYSDVIDDIMSHINIHTPAKQTKEWLPTLGKKLICNTDLTVDEIHNILIDAITNNVDFQCNQAAGNDNYVIYLSTINVPNLAYSSNDGNTNVLQCIAITDVEYSYHESPNQMLTIIIGNDPVGLNTKVLYISKYNINDFNTYNDMINFLDSVELLNNSTDIISDIRQLYSKQGWVADEYQFDPALKYSNVTTYYTNAFSSLFSVVDLYDNIVPFYKLPKVNTRFDVVKKNDIRPLLEGVNTGTLLNTDDYIGVFDYRIDGLDCIYDDDIVYGQSEIYLYAYNDAGVIYIMLNDYQALSNKTFSTVLYLNVLDGTPDGYAEEVFNMFTDGTFEEEFECQLTNKDDIRLENRGWIVDSFQYDGPANGFTFYGNYNADVSEFENLYVLFNNLVKYGVIVPSNDYDDNGIAAYSLDDDSDGEDEIEYLFEEVHLNDFEELNTEVTYIKSTLDSVESKVNNKQDKLVAGNNVTIDPVTNRIDVSSSGGGGIEYVKTLPADATYDKLYSLYDGSLHKLVYKKEIGLKVKPNKNYLFKNTVGPEDFEELASALSNIIYNYYVDDDIVNLPIVYEYNNTEYRFFAKYLTTMGSGSYASKIYTIFIDKTHAINNNTTITTDSYILLPNYITENYEWYKDVDGNMVLVDDINSELSFNMSEFVGDMIVNNFDIPGVSKGNMSFNTIRMYIFSIFGAILQDCDPYYIYLWKHIGEPLYEHSLWYGMETYGELCFNTDRLIDIDIISILDNMPDDYYNPFLYRRIEIYNELINVGDNPNSKLLPHLNIAADRNYNIVLNHYDMTTRHNYSEYASEVTPYIFNTTYIYSIWDGVTKPGVDGNSMFVLEGDSVNRHDVHDVSNNITLTVKSGMASKTMRYRIYLTENFRFAEDE